MQAIIIVDCQNDFADFGSLPVKGGCELAIKIASFLKALDHKQYKFIFSRDWHPCRHISFNKWPQHCVENTDGAAYIHPLELFKQKDLEIKKGTAVDVDSYSAFYENHNESVLNTYLKDNKIHTIYVCGLVKDICVLQTLNDGVKMGFKTYLISDLTIALNEKNYNKDVNKQVLSILSNKLINPL